jgi:hypothetical protein
MDPMIIALIELSPFVVPPDTGDVAVYPNFAAPQVLKTINKLWENAKKYIYNLSHTSTSAGHQLMWLSG